MFPFNISPITTIPGTSKDNITDQCMASLACHMFWSLPGPIWSVSRLVLEPALSDERV
jgi:hypothetical protein